MSGGFWRRLFVALLLGGAFMAAVALAALAVL